MAVRAQDDPQYRMEIGAGVGVMTYEGDFNGNVLGDMQPAGFLVGRYNFDPYKDLKLSVGFGKIKVLRQMWILSILIMRRIPIPSILRWLI